MKSIAITIDEETLRGLGEFMANRAKTIGPPKLNRSEVVRMALRDYLSAQNQAAVEELDRKAFQKHKVKLSRELKNLVKAQSK
jgi:metal-responsive CopG/Arc/MetJ family transcriptional regulator